MIIPFKLTNQSDCHTLYKAIQFALMNADKDLFTTDEVLKLIYLRDILKNSVQVNIYIQKDK